MQQDFYIPERKLAIKNANSDINELVSSPSHRRCHELVYGPEHGEGIALLAEEPLLVLHVKFADVRVVEVLPVAPQVFFAHLARVDEVRLAVLHLYVVLKMGEQVGVVFVLYGLRAELGKAVHEFVRGLVAHQKQILELLPCLVPLFLAAGEAREEGDDEHGLELGEQGAALVQVGAAEYAVVDVDPLPLYQLADEA